MKCLECDGTGAITIPIVRWGHACGGDDELCALRCPVEEQDVDFEPCIYCNGTGDTENDQNNK